ncbi:hypothetical protein, partial [Pseudomonas sp.]|uniref:ADP-ribosyltransferase-containing protein n=1 Tax=Pseudomonas sp. TaxID=306 RepID=UPI00258EC5C5
MPNEYLSLIDGGALTTPSAPSDNPYTELINSQTQQADQVFKATTQAAMDTNPDLAAEQQRKAKALDIPPIAVESDPQAADRALQMQRLAKDTENAPQLKMRYGDLAFAKVAHDDSSTLSSIETAVGKAVQFAFQDAPGYIFGGMDDKQSLVRDVAATGYSTARMVTGLERMLVDPLAQVESTINGWTGAGMGPLQQWDNSLAATGTYAGQRAGEVGSQWDDTAMGRIFGGGVSSGVQSMLQSMGGGVLASYALGPEVGIPVTLAALALGQGGDSYQKAREKGLGYAQSLGYGLEDAVAEYVGEKYFGIGGFLERAFAGASAKKLIGYEILHEVPGEMGTTLWQNFNEWTNINPNKGFGDWLSEQPEAMAQTIVATVVGGAGQIGTVKAMDHLGSSLIKYKRDTEQAETTKALLDTLNGLTEQSKTAARAPEVFQQFLGATTEGTPAQDLYIDGQTLLQSGVAEQLAAASPTVAEQLQAGQITPGGTIRIPTAEFVTATAGTDMSKALIDHVKLDPNGYTFAESQQYKDTFNDEIQAQLEKKLQEQQASESFQSERDKLRDDFQRQLDQSKRFSTDVNQAYANFLANFYSVTAARIGTTPQALYNTHQLYITNQANPNAGLDQKSLYKSLPDLGFTRLEKDSERTYKDTSGKAFPTFERDGVRISMSSNSILYGNERGGVEVGYGEPNESIVQAVITDKDAQRQGKASKALADLVNTADQSGTTLYIEPTPIEGGEMSAHDLAQFYKKFGFVQEKEGSDAVLVRHPTESSGALNQFAAQSRLEQMQAKAQAEYDAVVDQYQGTEQWLRAPNGNQTKLTERQWVQVRTPSFKAWFGDWEKFAGVRGGVWSDTQKEVSKVVDDNGEPLVVYHGTDTGGFTRFMDTGGQVRGDLGIFTTSNRAMAQTYVKRGRAKDIEFGQVTEDDLDAPRPSDAVSGIYAAFLNLRDVYETDFDGAVWNGERPGQYQVRAENGDLIESDSGSYYFEMFDDANQAALANPGSEVEPADSHFETTDDAVREARKNGNDGAIIRRVQDDGGGAGTYAGEPSDVFVAFDPGSIKSADQNIGIFGASTDNILLQSGRDQAKTPERDLVVTHNLTADNLLHAVKMGGIPVPSLAITKKDTPLTNFGEITLVGDEKLADPKGYASTKVFGADIYSPRYPSVERDINTKGQVALNKKLKPMADRMGIGLPDTQSLQRDGQRELERNLAVMGQFLRDKGIEPNLIDRPGMTPERQERLESFGLGPFLDVTDSWTLREDPAFHKAALDEIIDSYEQIGERRSGLLQKLRTDEDAQRNMVRDTAIEVANAAKLRQQPEIDRYATQKAMEVQVTEAELGNEFQQYVADLLDGITKSERIFQGFTYSGNRKYIPHTLENVVKLLKKELRGGENFNYGVGSLRAKYTPQFKSVAQIRASKERLISAEQFEAVKKEIDAEFLQVVAAINPDLSLDTGVAILEDAAKKGVARAAKDYGYDLTPEVTQQVSAFLEKLRTLPTAYFEAKILREVSLSEFKGAVVPEGVNPAVIEALKSAGVENVKTYEKGNEVDRAAKIGEFDNLFFQGTGNRGQITFGQDMTKTPSIIALLEHADLSTFIHESGHFFLQMQADLASRIQTQINSGASVSDGEREVVDDMNKILDWFGIKGDESMTPLDKWASMSLNEQRQYHEQWARGFEAYAFEGNAPTAELQGIFQRFSAWLLQVYKQLKNLNVNLTDEVRGVMDRMLATRDQIEAAEMARSMGPLFNASNGQNLIEDWQAYHNLANGATAEAIDTLQAKSLKNMQWASRAKARFLKQMQQEHDAVRGDVKREVTREVMSRPVYQLWQFLTAKSGEQAGAVPSLRQFVESYKAQTSPAQVLREFEKSQQGLLISELTGDRNGKAGLTLDAIKEFGFATSMKEVVAMGLGRVVRSAANGGMSVDQVAERLHQAGWIEGERVEDARHLLSAIFAKQDQRETVVHSSMSDRYAELSKAVNDEGEFHEILRKDAMDMASQFGEDEDFANQHPEAAVAYFSKYASSLQLTKLNPSDKAQVLAESRGKLSTSALKEMYGDAPDAAWRKLTALRMTSEKEGMHPAILAEIAGYDSADAMIQALAGATPPAQIIDTTTDQRMLERHGDLVDPKAREQAADAAVHNEMRIKMLQAEARALEKAMQVRQQN